MSVAMGTAVADVTYTTVPGKIPSLLAKIKDVGVPLKVTAAYLKTIGFTSSNDTTLVGVLRYIGFIDASGAPTAEWQAFRGPNGKAALGRAIKRGYNELYSVYSDAHSRSNTDIEQVFSMSTKGGRQVVTKIVSTFKSLAAQADFTDLSFDEEGHVETLPLHKPLAGATSNHKVNTGSMIPSLHIDMQIHISPEASADQIEQVFASMAKHLYGKM